MSGGHVGCVRDWNCARLVIFHRRHFSLDELVDFKAQTDSSELVFPSANSTPLRNRNFRRDSFDAATAALGLEITPHNLRDTAASLAIQAVLTVSLNDDHGWPFFIEAAEVAVGVVAGLILFVCTVSVTRNGGWPGPPLNLCGAGGGRAVVLG